MINIINKDCHQIGCAPGQRVTARKESSDHRLKDVDNNLIVESEEIFGDQTSEPARTMCAEINRVARLPYNILITGETGTGKTQAAREIHRRSQRGNKPFMELNCANLPEHLVEAELFGYRKGAFTGADRDHMGLFEEADGGTLFLDEVGDIAPTVQNRLLKAIDEKQIRRLGTNHYMFCDVQIIAATSRNLPMMIHNGEFREDLYCRLAVLTVETIPLRGRRGDIPAMIAGFLRAAANAADRQVNQGEFYRIEEDALKLLCEFDFPGNIRALRNVIYELTSYVDDSNAIPIELVQFVLARLTGARKIDPSDQQSLVRSLASEGDIILPLELCVLGRGETFKQWTARAKRCSIEAARRATGGTMLTVAERLGLTRCSLKSHLQRARRAQSEALFDLQRESD